MMKRKILVVDDEPLIRQFLQEVLKRKNYEVTTARDGEMAISLLDNDYFDLIITDMKMPKKNGLEVLRFAKAKNDKSIVIIMTAFGSIENAVDAMKEGAFNYLIKPFAPETIEAIIEKADEHLTLIKDNAYFLNAMQPSAPIVANSSLMKEIIKNIPNIAQSNASVFISGESGTGKEVIAEAIHFYSSRSNKPFVKVNCAAIPDTLIESEFFGYEKGAFTGANTRKEGRFEIANNGTLLLDEVTEIPIQLQPKLLRILQEQEFERVGGIKPVNVDVRIISTSNRNILKTIDNKIFREDLYYRLNVIPIYLPPLRERKEDIIPLANHFLNQFCVENHKLQKKFSSQAINKLISHNWPGNIRELANIIERTVVMTENQVIDAEHIYLDFPKINQKRINQLDFLDTDSLNLPVGITLEELERNLILATLRSHNNNRTLSAKTLGVNIKTLRNKLNKYRDEGSL